MSHKIIVAGIQWYEFKHGVETWILWRCACGCNRRRVEKVDGHWSAKQLGYEIAVSAPHESEAT